MKFLARTSLFFLFFFIFHLSFFILASPVSAQTPPPSANPYMAPETNPEVPKNLHTWTQTVMIEVGSAMLCQLAGINYANQEQPCLGIDQTTGKIGFAEGGNGLIGITVNMIAMLYTPPAHTSDYTTYLANNFGVVKSAHAQTTGAGFDSISPLLNLWTIFRNLTFLFITAIFVVIGFAIMLRVHIDQRTVMTIGNQLPKIVVGILLITFSYAIAGLLIDLMFVSTYVTINVFKQADPNINAGKVTREIHTPPPGFANEVFSEQWHIRDVDLPSGGGVFDIARQTGVNVQNIISKIFAPDSLGEILQTSMAKSQSVQCASIIDLGCWFGDKFSNLIGGTIGNLLSTIIGWVISWAVGVVAIIVVIIALLWALLRLWIALVTAYVFILIDIVTAPFWILAGLLPGSPVNFTTWLRDIVAHLSAYPVAIGMFLLGKVFMDTFGNVGEVARGELFVPPLIGNPVGNDAGLLGPLIGLGIVLITPQVVNMTKDFLKAPNFKYGAAIGQAISVGAINPLEQASKAGHWYYGYQHFAPLAQKVKDWTGIGPHS